jgi:hypothetical protein
MAGKKILGRKNSQYHSLIIRHLETKKPAFWAGYFKAKRELSPNFRQI